MNIMKDLDLWQKQEYTGMKPGLERMKRFLKLCGMPQEAFKAIHIAGTNGKGSTAKILSQLLASAGYTTGLYISPHILDLTERIQLNSTPISRAQLDVLVVKYSKLGDHCGLTFFEFMTGLAFIYFASKKVDIAVLETGLGGRFDATNTISKPLACIITDIDLDHKAILGNTLKQIAFEKAGIIKPGCPLVSGAENEIAASVIVSEANRKNTKLYRINTDFDFQHLRTDWTGGIQLFKYNGIAAFKKLRLSMIGQQQLKNCSLALAACELIKDKGFNVFTGKSIETLINVYWPGRFDIIRKGKRTYIIDGAHNPAALSRFSASWRSSPWSKTKPDIIFGMLKDKDYRQAAEIVSGIAGRVTVCPVDSPRNASPKLLVKSFTKYIPQKNISVAVSLQEALSNNNGKITLILGSLYLAGNALKILSPKGKFK